MNDGIWHGKWFEVAFRYFWFGLGLLLLLVTPALVVLLVTSALNPEKSYLEEKLDIIYWLIQALFTELRQFVYWG